MRTHFSSPELSQLRPRLKEKTEAMVWLEAEVTELKKQQTLTKKSAIEKFKSLDNFQEAVEFSAFDYFGEGFDFCKRLIAHHHPDLYIDIQGMGIDADLLEEEEKEVEEEDEEEEEEDENEKEKEEEKEKEKGDASPLSP